jgi:hypothetical protein
MRKRKVLTAIDGNSLSSFPSLESDVEFSTTPWERNLATSSKTPRISNTTLANKGRPPKPRQLSKDLTKSHVTTRSRKGLKKTSIRSEEVTRVNEQKSSAVTVCESSKESETIRNVEHGKNRTERKMDLSGPTRFNQVKLNERPREEAESAQEPDSSDEDMECVPDSASLDSDMSSDDYPSHPNLKTANRSTYNDLPVKKSKEQVDDRHVHVFSHLTTEQELRTRHSAPQVEIGRLQSEQKSKVEKTRPCGKNLTHRGLISRRCQGYTVGGELLNQSESLDGSEITIPTLGEVKAKNRRRWQKLGTSVEGSNLYRGEAPSQYQGDWIATAAPANVRLDLSEPQIEESDSSVEVWSIDDESASVPIKFVVDRKRYWHPPLPPGWEIKVSKSRKRPFYVHPDFGATWYCPVVLPAKEESIVDNIRNQKGDHALIDQRSTFEASVKLLSKSNDEYNLDVSSCNESSPKCMSDLVNRYNEDVNLQSHSNTSGVPSVNGTGFVAMELKSVDVPSSVAKQITRSCLAKSKGRATLSPIKEDLCQQTPVQNSRDSHSMMASVQRGAIHNPLQSVNNDKSSCPMYTCTRSSTTRAGHSVFSKNTIEREVAGKRVDEIDNLNVLHGKNLCVAATSKERSTEHAFTTPRQTQSSQAKSETKTLALECLGTRSVLYSKRTLRTTSEDYKVEGSNFSKLNACTEMTAPSASSIEHINSTTLVVQNTASAQSRPTANGVQGKYGPSSLKLGFNMSASKSKRTDTLFVKQMEHDHKSQRHTNQSPEAFIAVSTHCKLKQSETSRHESFSDLRPIVLGAVHHMAERKIQRDDVEVVRSLSQRQQKLQPCESPVLMHGTCHDYKNLRAELRDQPVLFGSHVSGSNDTQQLAVPSTKSTGGQNRKQNKIKNVSETTHKPISVTNVESNETDNEVFNEHKFSQSGNATWNSPGFSGIEVESSDESSFASPLRGDFSDARNKATGSSTHRNEASQDVSSKVINSDRSQVAGLDGTNVDKNDAIVTKRDMDLYASPLRGFEVGEEEDVEECHFEEEAIENAEIDATRVACKSERQLKDISVERAIQTASTDCCSSKEKDTSLFNEALSTPTCTSQQHRFFLQENEVYSPKQQARNETGGPRKDIFLASPKGTKSGLRTNDFNKIDSTGPRTWDDDSTTVPAVEESEASSGSSSPLRRSTESNLRSTTSVHFHDDSSTGSHGWGDHNMDCDTESEPAIEENKENIYESPLSGQSNQVDLNSDFEEQDSIALQTTSDLDEVSALSKPIWKRMSSRVLNPPLPLCSLQQLDVLILLDERKKPQKKRKKKRQRSIPGSGKSRITRRKQKRRKPCA